MWDNCSFNLNLDVHLCNEMDSNGQLNTNGIDSQAVMSDQTQYSPGLSVPTSNLELSKQNDAKENYGLDGDDQSLDDDIGDNAAQMDGDEPEVKKEFDDTNNELITENQVSQSSSSLHAPSSNEQSNQNLIKCKDEGDCDCDDCRNGIEVKEEDEEEDNDDDNYQTIEDNDEEYDLDIWIDGGSRNDEQLNRLEYGDIGDDARMDGDEVEVKEEIDDTNNELTNELPQNPPSLPAPASNDELSNQNDSDYGLESTLDGDDDQQQNEHLIYGNDVMNEHNEELSRPRKKLRLETTQPTTNVNSRQPHVTGQSLNLSNRNQTDQEQNMNQQTNLDERQQTEETDEASKGNNQDKQIIDISLQCLETDCPLMFNNKTGLNQHMSTQHGILSHKCLVKDCNQSFSTQYKLGRHIAHVHSNTTQWCCDKCTKHLTTYPILSKHNYRMHQLGQYQCAFSNCAFIAENRQEVANHYSLQHKTIEFTCRHSNCGRRFNDRSNFKRHQRAHLGIKPYRCKWPNCGYSATKDCNTIRHIKRNHFTPNSQATEQHLDNPKEYLEVLHDLL